MNCCSISFINSNEYIHHLKNSHQNVYSSGRYVCPVINCGRCYNKVESFRQHLNKTHFKESTAVKNQIESTQVVENEIVGNQVALPVCETNNLIDKNLEKSGSLVYQTKNIQNFKLEMLKLTLRLFSDELLPPKKST